MLAVMDGKESFMLLFKDRASDSGEPVTVDGARLFYEEILKRNQHKRSNLLNLQSMRLGTQSMVCLHQNIQKMEHIKRINLAENQSK